MAFNLFGDPKQQQQLFSLKLAEAKRQLAEAQELQAAAELAQRRAEQLRSLLSGPQSQTVGPTIH